MERVATNFELPHMTILLLLLGRRRTVTLATVSRL